MSQDQISGTDSTAVLAKLVAQRLDQIERAQRDYFDRSERRQDQALAALKELNGRTRMNETCLAGLAQWKEDHAQAHDVVDQEIRGLRSRLWGLFTASSIWSAITGLFGWLRGPPGS